MTADPLVIFKTRDDARVAPKSELPPDHPARRRPLGLAPGGGSSEPAADEPAAFMSSAPSVAAGLSAATLARPATMGDVAEALDTAIAIDRDGDELFRAKIGELRNLISDLKGELTEARHEIRELKLIQESLRISTRGESGRDGARGVPGRDGQQGPIGPRGERGERGLPAPAIVEWRPDPEAFTVQALLSDGSTGPMIALRSLFEAYHNATSWIEDADIVQAAHQARVENERQIEARRWATR
jgi:hypothetical protein